MHISKMYCLTFPSDHSLSWHYDSSIAANWYNTLLMANDRYSWSAKRWELVHCKIIWVQTTWLLSYNWLWVGRVMGRCLWSFWTWTLLQRETREPDMEPRVRLHPSVLHLPLILYVTHTHLVLYAWKMNSVKPIHFAERLNYYRK